jgi:cell division protein FtsB
MLKLLVSGIAVYLVISFVSGQIQVSAKQRQLDEARERLELQVEQNREMERLMAGDDETAYVERVARESLGYARERERVFIDLTGQ